MADIIYVCNPPDREGMKTLFDWPCIQCKLDEMVKEGLRGPGRTKGGDHCKLIKKSCPFVQTSSRKKGKLSVAPSAYYFKKYGLNTLKKNSTYLIGKEHFMFYMYHPELGCKPPARMPPTNRFGVLVNPDTDCWTLAHMNGCHWDDSKINLMWLLRSEHGVLEPNTKRVTVITSLREAGVK
jgi:hypothetical protein